nr:hypothetical protein [uncultured Holophaga sp.]
MRIKMVVQGLPDVPGIQNFTDPVEVEAAYLTLCQRRTDGPGAVKISSDIQAVVPDAYFRLDRDWEGPREQHPGRAGLWSEVGDGAMLPSVWQLRAVARILGESGEGMARRLEISGRNWRYWLSEGEDRREMPWTAWRVMRLWLEQP